jgi:hypothetical protein
MDELLHEHYQTLKAFTERLESTIMAYQGIHAKALLELRTLLADMQRATDAAQEEYEAF